MSMIPPQPGPFDPMKPPPSCPKCGHLVLSCVMCTLMELPKEKTVSTDDRLTMALYQMEQTDAQRLQAFTEDINFIFEKAQTCRREHNPSSPGFCERCARELHSVIIHRDAVNTEPIAYRLDEADICALVRQLFRVPISREGRSGERVHDLLSRLQARVGREKYAEYTEGDWPKRL